MWLVGILRSSQVELVVTWLVSRLHKVSGSVAVVYEVDPGLRFVCTCPRSVQGLMVLVCST